MSDNDFQLKKRKNKDNNNEEEIKVENNCKTSLKIILFIVQDFL